MIRRILFSAFIATLAVTPAAADPVKWPQGKRAAIVLSYDDGLASQLDIALPQLDTAGLKGTFFLNMKSPAQMMPWREAANHGHELANHTLSHPCPAAILPGRTNATETYSQKRILDEIAAMNDILHATDGKTTRTLAYPCSQTLVGGVDYKPALRQSGLVKYARGGGNPYNSVITDIKAINLLDVPSNGPTGEPDGAELIAYVERVREAGGIGVIMFHGVGGDYLKVSAEAHQQLVDYLKARPEIWVGTFQEVMDYATTH